MLVIRLQRTGRKGHAMFRIVVQDSRRSPSSGKVIAYIGNYDPHLKTTKVDKDKVKHFLSHGAQPSDRVVAILKSESIELPTWVTTVTSKKRAVRNPEKRRSTAPKDEHKPIEPTEEITIPENEVPTESPVDIEKSTEGNNQPADDTPDKPIDQPSKTNEAPIDIPKEA